MREGRSWTTTWTFNERLVTAREFHRLLRFGACPPAPAEVRCHRCRHLLYYQLVDLRKGLPFTLWRLRMAWVTVRIQLVRRFSARCEQCRFDRRVRGWL